MDDCAVTTISVRGQVVIPERIRRKLNLTEGTRLAVFGNEDTILLKRLAMPSAKEAFAQVAKWGENFAKEKGLKKEDVEKRIHKGRKVPSLG